MYSTNYQSVGVQQQASQDYQAIPVAYKHARLRTAGFIWSPGQDLTLSSAKIGLCIIPRGHRIIGGYINVFAGTAGSISGMTVGWAGNDLDAVSIRKKVNASGSARLAPYDGGSVTEVTGLQVDNLLSNIGAVASGEKGTFGFKPFTPVALAAGTYDNSNHFRNDAEIMVVATISADWKTDCYMLGDVLYVVD